MLNTTKNILIYSTEKIGVSPIQVVLVVALACLTWPNMTSAQQNTVQRVESILDRLEQRLLEQEQGKTSFLGDYANPEARSSTSTPVLEFRRELIEGQTDESRQLQEFSLTLNEIETQVERLDSDVQRVKQQIVENARIDNHVTIETSLSHRDRAIINSLSIKLDDFEVYRADEASGLFLPNHSLNVFSGPIPPGSHEIKMSARVVMKERDSIPLTGAVHRSVEEVFTINVPDGHVRPRFTVQINIPEADTGRITAELKASNL